MPFATKYQGKFTNQETTRPANELLYVQVEINITDTESGESDTTSVIPLELAETPLKAIVVDNSEYKFNVFRSKSYEINIHSSDTIGIETFINGGDYRYSVNIKVGGVDFFNGFLSIADIAEPFMPDPNIITLTATDGLGFLSDIDLSDFDGSVPVGTHMIIDYISWCLSKATPLNILVVLNTREQSAGQLSTSASILFIPAPPNQFVVPTIDQQRTEFFYPGQTITISGTVSNNGTFHVTAVSVGIVTVITVTETIVSEPDITATFDTSDTSRGHIFIHEYLESKTFEGSDIGTMIDCRTVIERILGDKAYITQWQGKWFIQSLDELRPDLDRPMFEFDQNGDFVAQSTITNTRTIGVDLPMAWMNEDAEVSSDRPLKSLSLEYRYEYPREVVCNIDFDRGAGADPTGAANETIDYVPECWDFLREGTDNVDLDTAPFAGSVGVLRKRFEYSYEKDRYFVTKQAGGFRHYFKSQGINVNVGGRLTLGVQYRFSTGIGAATINVFHVRLVGNDGSIYDWRNLVSDSSNEWTLKTATDPVFSDTLQENVPAAANMDEWHSISFQSIGVPVAGTLYIRLLNDLASPDERDFSGLTVTYSALVNGSYDKYQGQTHSVTQDGSFNAKRKETVYVSDAPDRNIKGALLKRGTDRNIFTGTVSFGSLGQFEMSGDHRSSFQPYIGQTIIIDGSTSNDQECLISSVSYSIVGDTTTVVTTGTTNTEMSVAVTIGIATFDLANRFYDAASFQQGPPDADHVHPYGEIQSFEVWNQYNRTMRKIEGTIDGMQSPAIADIVDKFILTDSNPNVDNKIFMCLHFEQDYDLCEWNATFSEVFDSIEGKQYTGHSFKYITG